MTASPSASSGQGIRALTSFNLEASITALPPELWLHTFSFLSVGSKRSLCLTCQEWRSICEQEMLWRQWYERDYSKEERSSFVMDNHEDDSTWQQKYRKGQAWSVGPMRPVQMAVPISAVTARAMVFDSDLLAIGSSTLELINWRQAMAHASEDSPEYDKVSVQLGQEVSALALHKNILAAGCQGQVDLFDVGHPGAQGRLPTDLKAIESLRITAPQRSPNMTWAIGMDSTRMVTGALDGSLICWDLETCNKVHDLSSSSSVYGVKLLGSTVAVALENGPITLYDWRTASSVLSIRHTASRWRALDIDEILCTATTFEASLHVFDIRAPESPTQSFPLPITGACVRFDRRKMLVGSKGTIHMMAREGNEFTHEKDKDLELHGHCVCLQFDAERLMCSEFCPTGSPVEMFVPATRK